MAANLLIIENNNETISILDDYFKLSGKIEVAGIAKTGVAAIEKTHELAPDMILLDIILPIMDGFDVLESMLKNPPEKIPKKVVMSVINKDSFIRRAFELGADYFILKPFDLTSLLQTLLKVMNDSSKANVTFNPVNVVSEELIKHSIHVNTVGFKYLRETLLLSIKSEHHLSFIKEVYPFIADKFVTTPECVEKAMRNSIKSAYNERKDLADETFYNTVKYPTITNFIATLSEQIKIKYAGEL